MTELTEFREMVKLLNQLPTDEFLRLEFGEDGKIGKPMSYIRVRYMNTVGGMKYRWCTLYNGFESSGHYHASVEETALGILKAQAKYLEPSKFKKIRLQTEFQEFKPKLTSFFYRAKFNTVYTP